jgi:tetratricopeptide (TPR) repeat protein
MPEPGTFRLLLFCRASLLALTISASPSLFAKAPLATQSEITPDAEAYRAAIRLPDQERRIEALERFLVDYPQSRYAAGIPNLIFDLLLKDGQKEKILAQANRVIDKAPENAKSVAYYTVAAKLLRAGILIDEAEVFAVKAVSTFKESKFLELQRQTYNMRGQTPPPDGYLLKGFNSTRATYLVTLGQIYFKKGRDAEAEKAFKDAHKANPTLEAASIGLATILAKSGDNARAVEIMVEAAVSGRMTREARQLLEELYRKTHQDSLSGLEEMLDERYRRAFANPFRVKHYKPGSSRTDRVVLAEVFTGSGCPPCVAADLAFDAVLDRYERRDVSVLMYHLHIPRPDPMANAATQNRATFYRVRGVPSYMIDGQAGGGGGSRESTEAIYNRFNPGIEKRLEVPGRADIKLETALDGGVVKVRATVAKVESQSPSLKLNLALVEKSLRYGGENGVRFHPMVVRGMGGPDASGFPLLGAQPATFEQAFDLAQLTGELKDQLDEYERRNFGLKFSEKKDAIDAANLAVVAFVQDEENLQILQASQMDVKPGSMQLKAPSELAMAPASQPSDRPAVRLVDKPADKPAVRLVDNTADRPSVRLVDRPADNTADMPDGENPIIWKLKAETPARPLKLGETFTAQLSAQIAAGWHLYSSNQSPDGPRPTRITLPAEQSFKLAGEIEAPPPQTALDENFGFETSFYENSATFTLPVRVAEDVQQGRHQLRVNAYFQTCNDRLCLPPKTVQLVAAINVATGVATTENKPGVAPSPPVNRGVSPPGAGAAIEIPAGLENPPLPWDEELRQDIARRQAELRRWRNTGNTRWEAETLHQIGAAYFSLSENHRALDYYQQALPLWRALKDSKGEGKTLNNLGLTFHSQGERSRALDYYQQALQLRRLARDREGEVETLNNMGRLHSEMSQYEQAINYYQQAFALRQTLGDRVGKADALHKLGEVYEASGDKSKARDFYGQSLRHWQAMGKKREEAHILNHLGAIHSGLGEKQEALDYYQKALQASRAAKASDEEAIALKRIGQLSSEK